MPNPVLGVLLHWPRPLASGDFYVPCRGVKDWAWETYCLAGGFFSWIISSDVNYLVGAARSLP